MSIGRYLSTHRILFVILFAAGIAAAVEIYQRHTYHHLQERLHPRGSPQLQGESLRELALVLIDLYPEGAESNLTMGLMLAEQGQLREARRCLEKALEIDRHNQQLLLFYARLLMEMGERPEKVRAVIDELRRDYPRAREQVEEYFTRASKGKIHFAENAAY